MAVGITAQQPAPGTPPTTRRTFVNGVAFLTIVMLFTVFFWVAIGLAAAANPPKPAVSASAVRYP